MGTAPARLNEIEPNDNPANAMRATLADTINAAIGTDGDVDFFAVDLDAGTQLDANVDISGSALYNPTFGLFDRDGVTPLLEHNWESSEYRLRYRVTTAGRYYLRVGNYRPGTGTYVLRIGRYARPTPGPGDPITTLWSSSDPVVSALTAGPRGDLYVGNGDGIFRLSAAGDSTPFVSGIDASGGVLVDLQGNVLTLGCEFPQAAIWRISPSGQRSRFFLGPGTPRAGTIGPDGDVWINDDDTGSLWRFDAQGNRKGEIGSHWFALHLAFSPAGDLYFSNAEGLHEVVGGSTQVVIPAPDPNHWFGSFVFDRDGYCYVVVFGNQYEGAGAQQVLLFDPQFHPVQNPFAQVGDHFASSDISDLVFARDADGRMTKRLLVGRRVMTTTQDAALTSEIVELNTHAIRAPGWVVGGPLVAAVVSAALGVDDVLTPDQKQLLDQQGNHNGVFDIGDVRAYLRSRP